MVDASDRGKGEPKAPAEKRGVPWLAFFGYYVVVIAAAALLISQFELVRRAFVAPIVAPAIQNGAELLGTAARGAEALPAPVETLERALLTLLMTIGTLVIVLPVAWVYMHTRTRRFDRALVQSVIILPIVVGGIILVVKNSLALAFGLAGIVAAVRFRHRLKDPRDAVYIFMAIGLGIAAGVQALDIALVISLAFNVLGLLMWKSDLISMEGETEDAHAGARD